MPTFYTGKAPDFSSDNARKNPNVVFLREHMFGAGLSQTTGDPIFWAPITFQPNSNNAGVAVTIDQTTSNVAAEIRQSTTSSVLLIKNTNAGATGAVLDIKHDSESPAVDDVHGRIRFIANNSSGAEVVDQRIDAVISTATAGSFSTKFVFWTSDAGTGNEAFRILSEGRIQVDVASAIAGTTGTADVFDDYDDIAVISKWNKNPAMRIEFMKELEAMGIAERKNTGSGWMLNLQRALFLAYGGITQLYKSMDARLKAIEERLGISQPLRLVDIE
jgi:hypothetical protein